MRAAGTLRAARRAAAAALRAEDGIAMPVALAVLLICVILTGTVATGADRLTGTSGQDVRGKRAFAAADAGIGVAVARLRALGSAVKDTQCLTTVGVDPGTGNAAAGECPSYGEVLGGGARFDVTVTPATTTGAGCYQLPGAVVPAGALRRCVTSIGTVDGVTRRVQAQVVAPRGARHWVGILGLDGVTMLNSPRLDACPQPAAPLVASNVKVDSTVNSSTILNHNCPSLSWTLSAPQAEAIAWHKDTKPNPPNTFIAPTPYVIDPPPIDWEVVENTNDNSRLVTDVVSTGNGSFNTTTRVGALGSDSKVVLKRGGDYHLCGLNLGNQSSIDFSTTERTRIFIDSPMRPDSSCPAGSGYLETVNGARFNWPSTVPDTATVELSNRAKNVELYFYGNGKDLVFTNHVRFAGLVHAPRTRVVYDNGSTIFGAVAAKAVVLQNQPWFRSPIGLDQVGGASNAWAAQGWGQCSSRRTTQSDPESGC